MSEKLSKWFPKNVRPSIVGVYEVDDRDGIDGKWFAWWDGEKFGYRMESAGSAARGKALKTGCARLTRWRGLAEKPEA